MIPLSQHFDESDLKCFDNKNKLKFEPLKLCDHKEAIINFYVLLLATILCGCVISHVIEADHNVYVDYLADKKLVNY